jgi:tRNA (guanine37-N1)-methyltransferase
MKDKMRFDILTIFPNIFEHYFKEGLIARANKNKIIQFKIHNIRDYSSGKHKKVDDTPYGGGPGMIMKVGPIYRCLKKIKREKESKVILLDPRGRQFNQKTAREYTKLDQIILICGRYEGIDERVKKFVDENLSVGNYILNGGEIAALAVVEATSRLLKGFLGDPTSLEDETFSQSDKQFKYPQYTRPFIFKADGKEMRVPKVLLSGNHQEIEEWRKNKRS